MALESTNGKNVTTDTPEINTGAESSSPGREVVTLQDVANNNHLDVVEQPGNNPPALAENKENTKISRFKPGESGNPAGRAKGTKNKYTRIKEMILGTIDNMQGETEGEWLNNIARNDPINFLKVAASLLPKQVEKDVTKRSASVQIVEEMTPEQKKQMVAEMLETTGKILGPRNEKAPGKAKLTEGK
tara:strand:- start:1794 stop:2357 length:564 start_codon:yes stop_codon:yes gene_type:complete